MFDLLQEDTFDPPGEVMAHFPPFIADALTGHAKDADT